MSFEYSIDENGQLRLQLQFADKGYIRARIYSPYTVNSDLVKHILALLTIETGEQVIKPDSAEFQIPTDNSTFILKINGYTFAHFTWAGEKLGVETRRKLSVFETRIIGRSVQNEAPYAISPQNENATLPPITDLHTHLSAQISGHDLITLGRKPEHAVFYPTVILDKLNLKYSKDGLTQMPKRIFLPLAHLQNTAETTETAVPLSSIHPESLAQLEKAMHLSPEGQSIFGDIESVYYMREPFTKDVRLLPDILHAVARDYKNQGIRYAELSSNAVLDPVWLETIHRVMPAIEKENGLQLRFKAGLMRNLNDEALTVRIEQYKRIAASPYVVGTDILGYEINKTSHMQKHLERLAQWMKQHQPDDIIQIHAGENAKNLANVKEALQLAVTHHIRMHVGHSLYGIDDEAMLLAQKIAERGDLIVQFNIDSNLAINNIDFPQDVPIARFIDTKIPSVLSTDGAGMYLTSASQTAKSGLFCGVTAEGFTQIRKTEEAYIARQQAIFAKKTRDLPKDFFEALTPMPKPAHAPKPAAISSKQSNPRLDELIASSKRPLLFAGAGGKSWDNLPAENKKQFTDGLSAMLRVLDPDRFYFVTGRTKDSGINIELEKAIIQHSEQHGENFCCVTMLAESEAAQHSTLANFHTLKLAAPLVFLPTAITGFLKEHRGFAFFAGGKNFTRDFILAAVQTGVPFALMKDIQGASREKAQIYTQNAFAGASEMEKIVREL